MVTAVVTVIMFLILISIHEFGHFIVAKMCGVKVLEFSVGVGPAILKKQAPETLYSIRLLPFGGYCKFEAELEKSDDKRSLSNQPAWKRLLILIAGATLNIILGYIIFAIILSGYKSYSTNIIKTIYPDSYFAQAGAMAGDRIVCINGHNIGFYPEIELYSREFQEDKTAKIKVKRGNEKLDLDVPLSTYTITQTYTQDGILSVTETNGVKNEELIEYSDSIEKNEELMGKTFSDSKIILGFTPQKDDITPVAVIKESYHYTCYVVKLVYKSLFDMVTGKLNMEQVSGPVGIISEVNNAVSSETYAVQNTLNLIALLTINLGIFNLLPIPALDGGRILFIIIELIRRKPVPPEKEEMIHVIGFALLLLLVLFVTFFDIMGLVNK